MRKIGAGEDGVADVCTVPQPFAGSERVLACFQLLEIEPGSTPTTILKTPTRLSWGFFLGDRAWCPVFVAG
jgi:hypothetical protein